MAEFSVKSFTLFREGCMKLAHRSVPKQTEIHVFGIVKFKVALVAVIT